MTLKIDYETINELLKDEIGRQYGEYVGRHYNYYKQLLLPSVARLLIDHCQSLGPHKHDFYQTYKHYPFAELVSATTGEAMPMANELVVTSCVNDGVNTLCHHRDRIPTLVSTYISERNLADELDDAERSYSLRFCWPVLSTNKNISLKFIDEHHDLPWAWANVLGRSDITTDLVRRWISHLEPEEWGPYLSARVRWIGVTDTLMLANELGVQVDPSIMVYHLTIDDLIAHPEIGWELQESLICSSHETSPGKRLMLRHLLESERMRRLYKENSDSSLAMNIDATGLTVAHLEMLAKEHGLLLNDDTICMYLSMDDISSSFKLRRSKDEIAVPVRGYDSNVVVIQVEDLLIRDDATEELIQRLADLGADFGEDLPDVDFSWCKRYGPQLVRLSTHTGCVPTKLMVKHISALSPQYAPDELAELVTDTGIVSYNDTAEALAAVPGLTDKIRAEMLSVINPIGHNLLHRLYLNRSGERWSAAMLMNSFRKVHMAVWPADDPCIIVDELDVITSPHG
jgi:hypothetical protein